MGGDPCTWLNGALARELRVEDPRLVTGQGHYVDDIQLPGTLHAAFVRSHIAHGRIRSVDVSAAREAPGVSLVLTAADLEGGGRCVRADGTAGALAALVPSPGRRQGPRRR